MDLINGEIYIFFIFGDYFHGLNSDKWHDHLMKLMTSIVRAGQYLNTLYLNTVFKYIYCIYALYLNTFFNLYLITVFKYF